MNTKFVQIFRGVSTLLLFLMVIGSPIYAQPVGGAGRSVVPGTHLVLSDTDGGFTPSSGATWVSGDGWVVTANESAVQTPTFNLEYLRNGNLKWYVRTNSPNSTYVDFAEFYGSTPGANSGNFHLTTEGFVETFSGDLDTQESFTEFSMLISKAAFIPNPPEADMYPVQISEFWIEVNDAALPVKLVNFKAEKQERNTLLSWITVSEINNQGFQIERSLDGRRWNNIGFVDAKSVNGNSNMAVEYNFVDSETFGGENLYRLKQIDIDGSYQYSNIRQVKFDLSGQLVVYPNPAIADVTVEGVKGIDEIVLLDLSGRVVKTLKGVENKNTVSLNGLSSGMYFMQIIGQNQVVASKLISKN